MRCEQHIVLLACTRTVAWTVTIAALLLTVLHFDTLPNTLPISYCADCRVPKTWLLALTKPLINLASLLLCEVLYAGVRRIGYLEHTALFAVALLVSATGKAVLELPLAEHATTPGAMLSTVGTFLDLTGFGSALLLGIRWFRRGQLRRLSWSKTESTLGLLLLGASILLDTLPVLTSRRGVL